MGYNIIKDDQIVGWTKDKYADDSVTFINDKKPIPVPAQDLNRVKQDKISAVKRQAATLIAATDWQLQRAQERDALGISTDTPIAVYSQREAIRRASNRAEMEIDILDSAFDVNEYQLSVEPQDYPNIQVLTHLQFMRRFTLQERVTIEAAALQSTAINDYVSMLRLAKFVNIKDLDVILGVNMLEQNQIIAAGRAAQILVSL